jgi:hypothetical protein
VPLTTEVRPTGAGRRVADSGPKPTLGRPVGV